MKPEQALQIDVQHLPDATVVRLTGSATIDQADRLNYELREVAGRPVPRIVLDLGGLEFICSMGLGALIVAHVVSRRRQAQVVIVAPQPAVREILETTRLDHVFPIFADIKSALAG